MKKIIYLVLLLASISLAFTGCAVITNILDPLPDNYVDGVKVPKEYPDDYIEIYDDAIVYESDEDDGEVELVCGSEDEIDDVIDFYEDLFDDDEFTINNIDEGRDEYFIEGVTNGYEFEVYIQEAKGNYEERAFATTIEIKTKQLGKELLDKMQGFWLISGSEGIVDDQIRRQGLAIDISDMKMDFYAAFEIDSENIEFVFLDDETIRYTEDGDDYTVTVKFEKIDGIEVMSMTAEGETFNLEKSSYNKMMEYAVVGADTLAKMQGFWLACGIDGQIDDTVRMEGTAVIISDNLLYSYSYFEMNDGFDEFEFIDDSSITYFDTVSGVQIVLDITFETIDGIEVMTLSDEDVAINFEKSSEELMWFYMDMGGEEGELILLTDDLSDADIELIFVNAPWTFTYVYDPLNAEYSLTEISERIIFYDDYTGLDLYEGTEMYFTWSITNSIITIVFEGSDPIEFLIDLEYDGSDVYVYLFDSVEGYNSYAAVYMIIE